MPAQSVHIEPSPLQIPQLSSIATPPHSPAQSAVQSLVGSLSQVPQLSAMASPIERLLQSVLQVETSSVVPPTHSPQASMYANPPTVSLQSVQVESFPPQTPQLSST